MERATLIGIKTRVKVLIAAKQAAHRKGIQNRVIQPRHPLLTAPGTEGVFVRSLDSGLALDLTKENIPGFADALAQLTCADSSRTQMYM